MLKARAAAQAPAMNTVNVNELERGVGRREEPDDRPDARRLPALVATLDQNASRVQPHDPPILPLADYRSFRRS